MPWTVGGVPRFSMQIKSINQCNRMLKYNMYYDPSSGSRPLYYVCKLSRMVPGLHEWSRRFTLLERPRNGGKSRTFGGDESAHVEMLLAFHLTQSARQYAIVSYFPALNFSI
jgi:hypothetical protein